MSHLDEPIIKPKPSKKLLKWSASLSYEDRLKVREFLFRLYTISEDMRIERKTKTTQIYKTITINKDELDDKTIEEWQRIDKAVKNAEKQFMNAQIAKDVEKMIKDSNERHSNETTK